MDLHTILIIAHVIGVSLGVGGALMSDIVFLRAIKKQVFSRDTFEILDALSHAIWGGFWLLIASGFWMFWLIYSENNSIPMLASSRWQVKLALVGVVFINGVIFRKKVFPLLKTLVGQPLTMDLFKSKIWLPAISGAISFVSWVAIVILSLLLRTFRPHYLILLGAWAGVVIVGSLVAKAIFTRYLGHSEKP